MLAEILNKNLSVCYWTALVKFINPQLVITFTDNHPDFYKIAKNCKNNINFAAIQNAYRDESYLSKNDAEKIFIPNYFCFGQQTEDHYKKIGAKVKNYYKCGSLRQHYADQENKPKQNEFKEFDICLISENLPPDNDPVKKERLESLEAIAQNVKNFTIEKRLKTILVLKRDPSTKRGKKEINFYQKIFGENSSIKISQNINENFKNYNIAYKSKLVIGSRSTLLLEALGYGSRIMVCNYKQKYNLKRNDNKDFERLIELNPLFNYENFFSIFKNDYKIFKDKASEILEMKDEVFRNKIKEIQEYMIVYERNSSSFSKIKKQIDIWVN